MANFKQFRMQIQERNEDTGVKGPVHKVKLCINLDKVDAWYQAPETEHFDEGTMVQVNGLEFYNVLLTYSEFNAVMKENGYF